MNWVNQFLSHPEFLEMGHAQSKSDNNLGLGWIYYALARVNKPKNAICIGSWRGFVPMLIAKAIKDNQNDGQLIFIDPSLADDFWRTPSKVNAWFEKFELSNIHHHLKTTQQFIESQDYQQIASVDFLFIDGYHTAEQAKLDFEAFEKLLSDDAFVLFHDSIRPYESGIYGEDSKYTHTVYQYMAEFKKRNDFQFIEFEQGSGVSVFKKRKN